MVGVRQSYDACIDACIDADQSIASAR